MNYWHYSPPPGFHFEPTNTEEVIKDDPSLQGYNLDVRAKELVNYLTEMAQHYKTKNVMHTIGEDFTYSNARMAFKNYDKLIKYINNHTEEFGLKIVYSTPNEYIDAIRS